MPEYGRIIQNMVDKALTIEDRATRQEYAELIVRVMGNFYPQIRNVPGFVHKLWDHLAYMSGYKLDIDYPVEISESRVDAKPAPIPYPMTKIRFRHYGHLVETLINNIEVMPDDDSRQELIKVVARRMRADLSEWRGEGGDTKKIADDISFYTKGKLTAEYIETILNTDEAPVAQPGATQRNIRRPRRTF